MNNATQLWRCPLCKIANARPRVRHNHAGAFITCPNCGVHFQVDHRRFTCPAAIGAQTRRGLTNG